MAGSASDFWKQASAELHRQHAEGVAEIAAARGITPPAAPDRQAAVAEHEARLATTLANNEQYRSATETAQRERDAAHRK